MEASTKKLITYIVAAVVLIAIGFFIGRKTIKTVEPKPIYEKGDTVYVNKPYPVPVKELIPADTADVIRQCIAEGKYFELFPEKVRDSLIYITPEDTSAILRDWATKRFYSETILDCDTVGTAKIDAIVQYNRLKDLSGTFVPVIKTVKEYQIKKYSPFVKAGISTAPYANAGAGIFFNEKYGVSVDYNYLWEDKKSAIGMSFYMKF